MAYATAAQMLSAVGSERLKRLIPDVQTESLETLLTDALTQASGKIDGTIGHVYESPVNTTGQESAAAVLQRVNILLALEILSLGVDKLPDAIKNGITWANGWIQSLAKRELRLPGITSKVRGIVAVYGMREDEAPNALTDEIFEAHLYL